MGRLPLSSAMVEFLGLGLVGMAYGLAQLGEASGFLAVFAAGLALQRVRERPRANTEPLAGASDASATMLGSVRASTSSWRIWPSWRSCCW